MTDKLVERIPTHRCKICGALWIKWEASWTLYSERCEPCCDNAPMGEQIEPLGAIERLWEAIKGDPRLENTRRKLSLHDLHLITKCAALASSSVPEQEAPIPSEREEIVAYMRMCADEIEEAAKGIDPIDKLLVMPLKTIRELAASVERGEHLTRQALEQGSAE